MFAEDRRLLPSAFFTRCVKDCLEGANSYNVFGGLFQAINQPGITLDGIYEGAKYFNSGLFGEIHPMKLKYGELKLLDNCAKLDWSKVYPSIFRTIFEDRLKTRLRGDEILLNKEHLIFSQISVGEKHSGR